MRLFLALPALIAVLAACSPVLREAEEPAPVMAEEEIGAALEPVCLPGEDDGIGGTGCQVD